MNTKHKLTSSIPWVASFTLVALLLGAGLSASAATATWNLAGGGTWNATASWTPATIPDVNTATVVFSKDFTTTAPTFTLDRNTAFTVNSISFQDTTTPFLGGTISVGTGTGSAGLIFAGTTPTVTAAAAAANASDLTISCPVDVTAGLTKAGARNVILSGTVTGFGSGVYNNVNAGTLEISTTTIDVTSLNKTTGAGTLKLDNTTGTYSTIFGVGAGTLEIGSPAVDWIANTKTTGAGTLKLDAVNTMTVPASYSVGAGTLYLNPASGTFTHDATGFTKSGSGALIFGKAATGSSTLTVNGGVLGYYASVSGFTSASVASGATLQIATTTTLPPLTLNGNGSAYSLEFPTGNTTTYTLGTVSISGDVIIRCFGLINGLTFPSAISSSGANSLTFRSEGGNTASQPWTFTLNAASSYTGTTTLNAISQQGILKLGVNNALPVTTTLTLNGGANANTPAMLDLNGKSQTLSGLNGTPSTGGSIVYATTAGTLTINNTSAYTFSGVIGGNSKPAVTFVKQGTGTQTLSGANLYTGSTTISGGILNAGVAQVGSTSGPLGASGNIIFGGGTLQFSTASAAWDPSARIAAGTSTSAVSIDANGQAVTFVTALTSSQSGGLTLSDTAGSGSLTLSAANSYTGNTTVSAGTLKLGASGSFASTPQIAIASGATLDVSAKTTSGFTITGSSPVQTLAASSTSGTATITAGTGSTKALTLAFGALLSFQANGTTPSLGKISVTGDLNLNANAVTVNVTGSALPLGDYILMSCTGTLANTGTFGTPTIGGLGLASGTYVASIVVNPGAAGTVVLHVINGALTTTSLALARTTGSSPSTYGSSLTYTATLTASDSSTAETGSVVFLTNGVPHQTVAIGSIGGGNVGATLTTANLPYSASTYLVTASYAGDSTYSGSSSAAVSQQVNQYALTLTGATAQSKFYDGTTAAVITGGTLSSTVNGDVITATTGTFASPAAGLGIAVTANLSGSAAASYTLTQPGLTAAIYASPTWTNLTSSLWDTAANWFSATVATGSGVTGDFSQINPTVDVTVSLNSPRTIGNMIFGDQDTSTPAGWTVDSNSTPANIITLAVPSGTPTITVNALGSGKVATINAPVTGTAGLAKAGSGTLVLTGPTTLGTGLLNVNNGKVVIGNGGNVSVGSGTGQGVAGGAELDINSGGSLTTGSYLAVGTSAGTSTFTLNSGGAFTNTGEFLICFTGAGTGVANINGGIANLLDFSYANGSGQTSTMNLNGGTVLLNIFHSRSSAATANINFNGTTVRASATTTDFIQTGSILTALVQAGGAIFDCNGNNVTINAPLQHDPALSSTPDGGLTKLGAGALTLTAANTYTGGTTNSTGQLNINNGGSSSANSAIGTGPLTLIGGTIDNTSAADVTLLPNNVQYWNGDFTYAGSVHNLNLGTGAVTLSANRQVTVTANNLTVGGAIGGGAVSLTKAGAGNLTLTGANTYTGGTVVSGGGKLILANASGQCISGTLTLTNASRVWLGANEQIADATIFTFATNSNGRFDLEGFNETVGGVQDTGVGGPPIVEAASDNTPGAPATLTLNVASGTANSFAGYVRDAAGSSAGSTFSLIKNGAGTQTFSGIPGYVNYSGSTVINNGVLEFSGANSVANNSAITVNSGGSVMFSGGGTRSTAISGGAGDVIKNGANTLTLSGANTYSGNTTISGGTLALSDSGSINNSTVISVAGGATFNVLAGGFTVGSGKLLTGAGIVGVGAVTVASGGTIAPGDNGIGTLTLTAAPALGGTLAMEIKQTDLTADKLNLTSGVFTYGGTLALTNTAGALAGGEVFDLFDFTGTSSGSFTTITTTPALAAGLNWWQGNLAANGTLVLNRAPSANDQTYTRASGASLRITKADLLIGASDPDSGDAPSYDALTSNGSQGATITEDGTYILYQPANDNNDTLQFRVKDNRGGTVTKNIQINVVNVTGPTITPGTDGVGHAVIRFHAIPGYSYHIQRATTLSPTPDWSDVQAVSLPSNGDGSFSWTNNASSPPEFYRLSYP